MPKPENGVPSFNQARHRPKPGGEVLWAIRAWVIGTCCSIPVEARIAKAIGKISREHAYHSLLGFLMATLSGAQRKLSISCMCNPEINQDEQVLLDILSLYQRGQSRDAMLLLRSIASAPMAEQAAGNAEEFCRILVASGYWLSPPSPAATQDLEIVFGDEVRRSGVTLN
jgi:hypothetical protein